MTVCPGLPLIVPTSTSENCSELPGDFATPAIHSSVVPACSGTVFADCPIGTQYTGVPVSDCRVGRLLSEPLQRASARAGTGWRDRRRG